MRSFGQNITSISSNRTTILLNRRDILTQNLTFSLRSLFSDSLLDHKNRHAPFQGYYQGLMLSIERKSVEPLAAHIGPSNVDLFISHFVADAPWWSNRILLDQVTHIAIAAFFIYPPDKLKQPLMPDPGSIENYTIVAVSADTQDLTYQANRVDFLMLGAKRICN